MKKFLIMALTGVLALSLVACGNSKPSIDDVLAALENGTLSTQDALEKGYVTEEWMEEYLSSRSIEGTSKLDNTDAIAFTTKTINGEDYTFTPSKNPMLFLFIHELNDETTSVIADLSEKYESVKSEGGDAVVVLMSNMETEKLKNYFVPVIQYDEEVSNALKNNKEMIEKNENDEKALTSNWNYDGAFIYAWQTKITDTDFPAQAKSVSDMIAGFESSDDNSDSQKEMGAIIGG